MLSEPSAELQILEYWQILQRRKFVFAITAVAILLITFLVTWFTPPLYQAGVKLLITKPQPKIMVFPDSAGYSQYQQNYLSTQVEIIKSLPVIRAALQELNPNTSEKDLTDQAFKAFSSINVSQLAKTDMVYLAVEGREPTRAVAFANSLATAFETESRRTTSATAEEIYSDLSKQLMEYKQKVDDAEAQLAAFLVEKGMVKVRGYTDVDVEKLSEFNTSYLDAVMKTTELQMTLEQLRKVSKDPDYASSVKILADNSLLQQLYSRLVDQDIELRKLERQYKESYPQVVELKADAELTKSKIQEEIRRVLSAVETELRAEQSKVDTLKGLVEQYKTRAVQLGENEQEYMKLEQEAQKYQDVYELLKKKIEEVQIVEELREDTVRIVEPATRASQVRPNVKANAVAGVGAALVLALSLALLSDYMDKSIRSFSQIRDRLGLQVLGLVPNMASQGDDSGHKPRIIPFESSRTPAAEAYRSLRTHLQFLQSQSSGQSLLVTSPVAGEGKSTTVSNLGIVMAQSGLRVLIVDSDLRRPSIHKSFGLMNTSGVSSVLSGRDDLQAAIKPTKLETLSVMCSGPLPHNPSELIGSKEMQDMVATLRERYDFLLFDSPPTIAVTDASLLAQILDGALLVIRGGGTSVEASKRAKEILEQVNAKIYGVVLNHVMPREGAYYYYYYYRYYDSYYYGPSRPKGDSGLVRTRKKA